MADEPAIPDTDVDDVEGHRLASNDNETIIEDAGGSGDEGDDVEGHRLATNDNETVVEDD